MANTYTQLYIHAVFAVKHRGSVIRAAWEEELYKYITGILQNHKHKMLIINGMPDHIHILFGMHPTQSLSQCIQTIKGESSEWINRKHFVRGKFEWQEGYGAFSCDVRKRDAVFKYIQDQKMHHTRRSFIDEYKETLDEFQVEFNEAFIFQHPR